MRSWLIQTLKPFQPSLVKILAVQLVMAVIIAIQPLYMQQLVGVMLDGNLQDHLSQIIALALTLAALFACVAICRGVNGYLSAIFSSELLRKLQTGFFQKTAQLPLNYFQHSSSGEFFTRFNHDVGQTQNFIANILPSFVREAITATVLFGVLLWYCPWQLVAAGAVLTTVTVALAIQCHRTLDRYAIRQRQGWNEINKQFGETLRGIDTIKTFGVEQRSSDAFEQKTEKFRSLSARAGKITALFSPVIDLVTRLGGLGMIVLAFFLIAGKQLGIEVFLLFFFCSALLQGSITSMINLYTQMPQQLVGMNNLAQFFNLGITRPSAIEETSGETEIIDSSVAVKFTDLRFSYADGKELYGGESFEFPAKGITLLQGSNGSGKSTLINLLLRFYSPDSGSISIGGKLISSFSDAELRNKISVVKQYHYVFDDTLRENLLIAKPGASDKELLGVLSMVALDELCLRSELGLDQHLSSVEHSISGGERQRLNLARILLRDTPVIVFDEPWSYLDRKNCEVLYEIINQIRYHKTVIIISHSDQANRLKFDQVVTIPECEVNEISAQESSQIQTNATSDSHLRECFSL